MSEEVNDSMRRTEGGMRRYLRAQAAPIAVERGARLRRQVAVMAVLLMATALSAGGLAWWIIAVRDPVAPVTVEPFALQDATGAVHRPAEWRDARAVVLLVIGTECPISTAYAQELGRLAAQYKPEGVLFYGVNPDPSVSAEVVASHADKHGFRFPVLLDPAQELTGDLGVRVTPEAAVLDGQGHVLYRGPIDDRVSADGTTHAAPRRHDLENAIRSVLDGALPRTAHVPAHGTPLPKARQLVAEQETVTFNKHVAPILWEHCAGCHRPGQVGPFSLLKYTDAAKRASFLSEVAASRQMPPWRAIHGYGDFHDASRLSGRELALLARWADSGAAEGDPGDRGHPPTFSDDWQLGKPDLVVSMNEAFTVPAGGTDIYRAFVLPVPLDRDTPLAAVEFRPGNRRIVHHARFFVDSTDDCRRRDQADPGLGFEAWGGGNIQKPDIGAWVPGLIPRMPPPDVGKILRKGSDLVMLIHYHGTGKNESDQSSLGLYFSKTAPARAITTIPLNSADIDIPPGVKRHRITVSRHMAADAHAVSILPHGHFLMREISLTAFLPGGKVVPMLWIQDWNFNWQGQYHYARPVPLPKGTRLDIVAYYDNSADNPSNPSHPPRRVKVGYASNDEMLGCHLGVIADNPESQRIFDKVLPFGR
jgi:peroxiredoxin